MKTGVYPLFKDLFPEENPSLDFLLEGFSLESGLSLVSALNAEVYFRSSKSSFNDDIAICGIFMRCVSLDSQKKFIRNITLFSKKVNYDLDKLGIFTQKNILSFINYLIVNLNSKSEREYIDEIDDFNFLKAYFLFVESNDENLLNKVDFSSYDLDPDNTYYKIHWPLLINQFEFAIGNKTLKNQLILGLVVLHFLSNDERYKNIIASFLNDLKSNSFFDYVYQIISHFEYVNNDTTNFYNRFLVKTEDEFLKKFYESNALNIEEFRNNKSSEISFTGLKSKPLYKVSNDTFLVLDWSFFYKKIYDSLYFDLFEKTDFKILYNHSFPNFKSEVIAEMLEENVFVKLIDYIFKKKYSITIPNDIKDKHAFADYYIRDENKIFLYEFKSSLFSGKIKDSLNVEEIKNEIDKKINKYSNKKSKGSGQLINQIKIFKEQGFSFDRIDLKGYKLNKMELYPIIVVEEEIFKMPGVNDYIKKDFRRKVDELGISFHVIDITIISLEFFLSNISFLKENRNQFSHDIKNYHKETYKNKKRIGNLPNLKEYHKIYRSFEEYFSKKLDNRQNKTLRIIFDIYGMNESIKKFLPSE
jgi:hypothetical protein